MMRCDFEQWLTERDEWDYSEDRDGLVVLWENGRAMSHVTWRAIADNDLAALLAACKQGRDVDHITRVTGYFSKVSAYNPGKVAELRDRARVKV